MKVIKASIIIPTCNRAKWLNNTIQSVLLQNYPSSEYEALIVDNGSKDNTKETVEAAASKNAKHNIKYFFEPVPGSASARHCGALNAKGDILVFTDDDVAVVPGWLSSIMNAFEDKTVHLVGGPSLPKYEVEPPKWIDRYCEYKDGRIICGSLSLLDKGDERIEIDPVLVWSLNFSIRKNTLFEAKGFHPCVIPKRLQHLQGDGETGLSLAIKEKGYKAIYDPGVKLYHYIPRERLTVAFFEGRYFYQGVADSYTQIRQNKGLRNLNIPNYTAEYLNLSGLSTLSTYEQYKQIIYQRIHNAHVDGFLFHQEAVKQSNTLLKWVLKEDYFDYRLPNLETDELQRIRVVYERIQDRVAQPQWPLKVASDMIAIAAQLIESGDMVSALSRLENAACLCPRMPAVHLGRALCLMALNRSDEAVRAAIAELTIRPDNKQALDILLKDQQLLLEELRKMPSAAIQMIQQILLNHTKNTNKEQ